MGNAMVGIRIAKQKSNGAPKDGGFRDINPAKKNPQNPYANPAKADGTMKGTPKVIGKLGK